MERAQQDPRVASGDGSAPSVEDTDGLSDVGLGLVALPLAGLVLPEIELAWLPAVAAKNVLPGAIRNGLSVDSEPTELAAIGSMRLVAEETRDGGLGDTRDESERSNSPTVMNLPNSAGALSASTDSTRSQQRKV